MKRKTISAILQKKINQWLASITDYNVRELARENTIVTGGAIASMLLSEEVKDYDIYFSNRETCLAVTRYYVEKFNESNSGTSALVDSRESGFYGKVTEKDDDRIRIHIESSGVAMSDESAKEFSEGKPLEDVFDNLGQSENTSYDGDDEEVFEPVFLSSNAITLSGRMQLVIRFFGDVDEIHRNYDFVHCTSVWTSKECELELRPEALECLMNKELRYMGSRYPVCSVIRTRKFLKRGYQIDAGQYLKMCFQISELDLNDIDVLEDQLVGVDSSYFLMLIDELKEKMEGDKSKKLTGSYVMSIIDKIF